MKDKVSDIIMQIEQIGIVPVIKLEQSEKAVMLANALRMGGINCAEVTFRAKNADGVIKDMLAAFPDMIVGAGTVLSIEQARAAVDAGAKFIVAPGFNPAVAKFTLEKGVPFIPGVASPTEIEQVMELGLRHVKFFPAVLTGGVDYIKAVSAPYPEMRFMPTGGIDEENIIDFLSYEKVFACGGSWMVQQEHIANDMWGTITGLSRTLINKILGFELAHVGINCVDNVSATAVANLFGTAFGFANAEGTSSIFSSNGIEIMKSIYLGKNGHIAIKTNSMTRALYNLKLRGFDPDESALKYDNKGKLVAAYLKQDFGGFAVHIVQKK